jgi:hypothetical protein
MDLFSNRIRSFEKKHGLLGLKDFTPDLLRGLTLQPMTTFEY